MQQYVTFVLTQSGQNRSDASAAVLILETLWDVNREMGGILPEWCFHNAAISQSDELQEHYRQWQQQQSLVFSYCKYPFLLDANAKRRLLSFDAQMCMGSCMQELVALSLRQALPADLDRLLQFRVRRKHLLSDFCGQLFWRLRNNRLCLRVPMSVSFEGEFGIDAGGLRKECLQLVLRQLCEHTSLFTELEELPGLLWFRPNGGQTAEMEVDDDEEATFMAGFHDPEWKQHLPEVAGAIVGLAAFNGIYLDLRLHPLIYRFFVQKNTATEFEDLAAMHPTLYRSLCSLRATDVRNLELTWCVRLPGSSADFNLSPRTCESGEATIVKQDDVEAFIHGYAEAVLTGAVREQLQLFTEKAVHCMAVGSAYSLCTANDLELMICGLPDLGNFKELEDSCTYSNGFTADSATVKFFWQTIHRMSELWKRKLLLFCTGSDRIPISGLKALHFTVSLSVAGLDHLPTANTCINQLNLPPYSSLEMMQDRLYRALEHLVGFGFA